MELISEPGFVEKTVTDLDVCYQNGIRSVTLGPDDIFTVTADGIQVVFAPTATSPKETLTLWRAPMLWFSVRERVVKWPVKPSMPAPAKPGPPDMTGA